MSDAYLTVGAAVICLGSVCIGFVLAAASLIANRGSEDDSDGSEHGTSAR